MVWSPYKKPSAKQESAETDKLREERDDYFTRLGLGPDATHGQVREAYRALMMKYHPDRATASNAEAHKRQFSLIAEAHDFLQDDAARRGYAKELLKLQAVQPKTKRYGVFSAIFSAPPPTPSSFDATNLNKRAQRAKARHDQKNKETRARNENQEREVNNRELQVGLLVDVVRRYGMSEYGNAVANLKKEGSAIVVEELINDERIRNAVRERILIRAGQNSFYGYEMELNDWVAAGYKREDIDFNPQFKEVVIAQILRETGKDGGNTTNKLMLAEASFDTWYKTITTPGVFHDILRDERISHLYQQVLESRRRGSASRRDDARAA